MSKIAPRSKNQLSASALIDEAIPPTAPRRGKNRSRTQAEIEYQTKVAELGCLVCRLLDQPQQGHTELHHFRFGGLRADNHFNVVGLCVEHHKPPRGWHGTRDAFKRLGKTQHELIQITRALVE